MPSIFMHSFLQPFKASNSTTCTNQRTYSMPYSEASTHLLATSICMWCIGTTTKHSIKYQSHSRRLWAARVQPMGGISQKWKNGPEMSYCPTICSKIYGPMRATLSIFVTLNNIGIYYSDAIYICFANIPIINWGGPGYKIAQLVNLS